MKILKTLSASVLLMGSFLFVVCDGLVAKAMASTPLGISQPAFAATVVGASVDVPLTATGGTAPYSWSVSAGTLNPHQPKQVVGASQVELWADPGLGG